MTPPDEHVARESEPDLARGLQTTTIESDGVVLDCSLVPWDSEIFGFPVAQITRLESAPGAEANRLPLGFEAWCAAHDVRLVSCRLDHARLRESMALEGQGFRFVEMVYGPRRDSFEGVAAPVHPIAIVAAEPGDLPAIEAIAYAAFTTGRFLIDWRLPPELSMRRYARWVRSSYGTTRQVVLKAESDGNLIGFFIVERRPDGSVYWHLTAIAPRWQGKGMGLSLWRAMLLRHRDEGATYVETTISGHNPAAMNLYARLGFSFVSAQITFHWLREAGPRRTTADLGADRS